MPDRRKSNWLRKSVILAVGLFGLMAVTHVCERRIVSVPSRVAGTYIGKYCGGTERLELHHDGRFSQRFTRDGVVVFDVMGYWRSGSGTVRLQGSMSLYDCYFWGDKCDGTKIDEELTIAFCGGELRYWEEDCDFALSRVR